MTLKRGDTVTVMVGKEKGKSGKITAVFPLLGRAIVEKLGVVKRHTRPTPKNRQGGIVEKESPISLSNLAIVCSRCHKPVRIRIKKTKEGRRERICVKCGEAVGS